MEKAASRSQIADFLRAAAGADNVALLAARRLSGGALRQNWLLDVMVHGGDEAGRRSLVLRLADDAPIAESRSIPEEFALLQAAREAGLAVAEPLWLEPGGDVLGRPFMILRHHPGRAEPQALVRSLDEAAGEALAGELARNLALLHRLTPAHGESAGLGFLERPGGDLVQRRIADLRRRLDRIGEARPVLEWAGNRLVDMAPPPGEIVLCHRDFRTGNYLVEAGRLSAVLDFEFAGWSDPHEDLGWFMARCWRAGAFAREAGGIAGRDAFLAAYEQASGRAVAAARLRFWENMAALRWAVIALEQGARHLAGAAPGLDLALTPFRALEGEYDLLSDLAAEKAA